MKTELNIEYYGNRVSDKFLTERAKEIWKADGRLMRDLETLELYYKPDEYKCYYVFNAEIKGLFDV